jgi:hypothetical protein
MNVCVRFERNKLHNAPVEEVNLQASQLLIAELGPQWEEVREAQAHLIGPVM